MARKATWQRHADPRSAPRGAFIYIIYILTYSINGSLSGLINPTILFLFLRVGLIPHSTYLAGDVARRQALDRAADRSMDVDRVEHGLPNLIKDTC